MPELAFVHTVVLDFLAVAALVVHVVGRVGDQQIRLFAAHERVDVPRVGAVADHQAVVAQLPDVANAAGGLLRQLHVVVVILGVTVHLLYSNVQAKIGEVIVQALDFCVQQGNVPDRYLTGGIVGHAVCLDLVRGKVGRHHDRNLFQLEHLGGLVAGVPDDDHAVLVHYDRLLKAKFFDAVGYRLDCRGVVARVVLVGVYVTNFPGLNFHVLSSAYRFSLYRTMVSSIKCDGIFGHKKAAPWEREAENHGAIKRRCRAQK